MRTLFSICFLSMLVLSFPAKAQEPVCGTYEELAVVLLEDYGATPFSSGLTGDGKIMKTFTSPRGVWIIVTVPAFGEACAVLGGKYLVIKKPLPVSFLNRCL